MNETIQLLGVEVPIAGTVGAGGKVRFTNGRTQSEQPVSEPPAALTADGVDDPYLESSQCLRDLADTVEREKRPANADVSPFTAEQADLISSVLRRRADEIDGPTVEDRISAMLDEFNGTIAGKDGEIASLNEIIKVGRAANAKLAKERNEAEIKVLEIERENRSLHGRLQASVSLFDESIPADVRPDELRYYDLASVAALGGLLAARRPGHEHRKLEEDAVARATKLTVLRRAVKEKL